MNVKLISIALILMLSLTGVFALSRADIRMNLMNSIQAPVVQNTVSPETRNSPEINVQSTERFQSNTLRFQPEPIRSIYPGNGLPYVYSTLITYENAVYRGQPFTFRSNIVSRRIQALSLILGLYVCDLNQNPLCNHSQLIPAYYWDFYKNDWVLANSNYNWSSLNHRFIMHRGEIKTIDTVVTYNGPMPPAGYDLYYCGAISTEFFHNPNNSVKDSHYRCRRVPLRG
jgi:hypothetical protein